MPMFETKAHRDFEKTRWFSPSGAPIKFDWYEDGVVDATASIRVQTFGYDNKNPHRNVEEATLHWVKYDDGREVEP